MKQNNLIKKIGVLCLAGFLMTTPNVFAETDSDVNGNANKDFMSKEQRVKLQNKLQKLGLKNEQKHVNSTQRTPRPQPKVDKLIILVKSIVGDEGSRSAVIEFEGEEMTVSKDFIFEGKFKVIDIYPDRMVVYSYQEQRRHTYKIIKEE